MNIVYIFFVGEGQFGPERSFLCPSGSSISLELLCDGTDDCLGGLDETNILCESKFLF